MLPRRADADQRQIAEAEQAVCQAGGSPPRVPARLASENELITACCSDQACGEPGGCFLATAACVMCRVVLPAPEESGALPTTDRYRQHGTGCPSVRDEHIRLNVERRPSEPKLRSTP